MGLAALLGRSAEPAAPGRRAVIDIGSNSIRLVVWGGPARLPTPLLNEKVAANLGRSLAKDGRLPKKATDMALAGLARFAALVRLHGVERPRVVATAAVRDAENGPAFMERVRALGLAPELLSGEAEARASALGVLSAFPQADGIVGDLGGGSLELVEVKDGRIGRGSSFPWGTLRLPDLRANGAAAFDRRLRAALTEAGWRDAAEGRAFYLVGGSWRALTQVAMYQDRFPLQDPHGYRLSPARVRRLASSVAAIPARRLQEVPRLANARIPSLPDAAALLAGVTRYLRPHCLIASVFGLREGLLYDALDAETRALDPLSVAVLDLQGHAATSVDGAAVARWIAPLFGDEEPGEARLRLAAACLSGAVQSVPRPLRATRAADLALHERWIGIDAAERGRIAAALLADAGEEAVPEELLALCGSEGIARGARWGQAIRFARKLAGGAPAVLERSALTREGDVLALRLDPALAAIYGNGAEQQQRTLAAQLGLAATRLSFD